MTLGAACGPEPSPAVEQEFSRLDPIVSEIAKLPGVEMHDYRPGELLLPTERLKGMHICVRDGALGLRLAVGRANHAILDVFGPGSLLTPQVWRATASADSRQASALLRTTTLELPANAFDQQLGARPPLALAVASGDARQYAALLDRFAMLALRDPLRRVASALLLLLERISQGNGSRLEMSQDLIAAFANLSRQTTNRQLRRLARAGLAGLERRVVDVRDIAALKSVALGNRPAPR